MGKQNINDEDESIINRWGWMEDYWDKLVVGASEQGGWDRPFLPGQSSSGYKYP